MKWYEKFRVGQKVRVVKKVASWRFPNDGRTSWNNSFMDKTIGKVYEIRKIDKMTGYQLSTIDEVGYNYWYPAESLVCTKGQQLLFNFME